MSVIEMLIFRSYLYDNTETVNLASIFLGRERENINKLQSIIYVHYVNIYEEDDGLGLFTGGGRSSVEAGVIFSGTPSNKFVSDSIICILTSSLFSLLVLPESLLQLP